MAPAPRDSDFPYWLVLLAGIGAYLFWQVLANDLYAEVLAKLSLGIRITLFVTFVAYASACAMGLALALAARSHSLVLRQLARFYIEIVRGVPIIVLLLYVAFVFVPALVWAWGGLDACLNSPGDCLRRAAPENWPRFSAALGWVAGWLDGLSLDLPDFTTRDVPLLWRAVIALALAYSAFIAEIFRAGLDAVDKGQTEAAQSLGLSRWQTFRHVVFPQAFRVILPPLGNDFVAMVKDSSLVSVLGVTDVTQLGKVIAAGNFRYFETYNVVALIYLTMTVTLSLLLRRLEHRLRRTER